jgi:hypothetical protein
MPCAAIAIARTISFNNVHGVDHPRSQAGSGDQNPFGSILFVTADLHDRGTVLP